jgi:hypothetical protein
MASPTRALTPTDVLKAVTSSGNAAFFYWSQTDKDLYKEVGDGICEGMCLDWLRRKFMGKRDFAESSKYDPEKKVGGFLGIFNNTDPNPNLPKLEAKQKDLHADYSRARIANSDLMIELGKFSAQMSGDPSKQAKEKQDPVQEFALAYNKKKGKATGFEKMTYFALPEKFLDTGDVQKARTELLGFLEEVLDGAGSTSGNTQPAAVVINLEGSGNHTLAYFQDSNNPFGFQALDPNAGEFRFKRRDSLVAFVGDWWLAAYSTKRRLVFELILYTA